MSRHDGHPRRGQKSCALFSNHRLVFDGVWRVKCSLTQLESIDTPRALLGFRWMIEHEPIQPAKPPAESELDRGS